MSSGYKRCRAIPGKQIAGASGIVPIEMSTTPPGHRRHHSRMETTDVSWREICGNEEELSLLFHHIEPDGVWAVGQATVVDGDLFAPPDCPAGVNADLAAGNVADVIRIRVVGVVVERPVAQRHGCRLLVPPPGEVVVKEARPIEEPLPVRLIHRDHRADLDQLTGRDIPAGKYSPAPLLR